MGTFLCPNALKWIHHVCRRNLQSIQGYNFKISSLRIPINTYRPISTTNLFSLNYPVKHNSINVIKEDIQNESKEKMDEGNCNDLYSNVDYDAITGGDKELLKKLKILMLELEVMIQEGNRVPTKLKTNEWKDLLRLETRSARKKMLNFMFINEMRRLNDVKKKAAKHIKNEERRAEFETLNENNDHIKYGFNGSTIFIRVYPTTMDHFFNNRLVNAMQFSQNLVVDCSYDSYMTHVEAKNCAKQIMLMFADNRIHDEPFNLHFCNADPNSRVMQHLHKFIPTMYDPAFPINVCEKSYLDIFPKEKLVYLTPHCRNDLTTFNHDDIYIIGAMVDKANSDPLSLAKAKSEGLRMACLPLDKHLLWQIGTKSLTLNQVLRIMLDIRKTNSWPQALVHVPKRKLIDRQEKQQKRSSKRLFLNFDLKD